jgi:hypothetical protein
MASLPSPCRALAYPRRHLTDREASAAAIDDPLTDALVAKAAYEPASVLVAASCQDVQHDQVDVIRKPNIFQVISREERPEPFRQTTPPRQRRRARNLAASTSRQTPRPSPTAGWTALATAESTECNGMRVLHRMILVRIASSIFRHPLARSRTPSRASRLGGPARPRNRSGPRSRRWRRRLRRPVRWTSAREEPGSAQQVGFAIDTPKLQGMRSSRAASRSPRRSSRSTSPRGRRVSTTARKKGATANASRLRLRQAHQLPPRARRHRSAVLRIRARDRSRPPRSPPRVCSVRPPPARAPRRCGARNRRSSTT